MKRNCDTIYIGTVCWCYLSFLGLVAGQSVNSMQVSFLHVYTYTIQHSEFAYAMLRQSTSYESRGARQVHSKTNQDNTLFKGKKELPWVGLEPTTLCYIPRQSALPTEL